MGILERLTALVRQNVNDLIDSAEDPRKVIRQAIRDTEASVSEGRTYTLARIAQEKQMAIEIDQSRRLADEWGRKAQAAVNAGRDDLAKEALRRRRDFQSSADLATQQHVAELQSVTQVKEQLRLLEAKLEAMRRRAEELDRRVERATAQEKVVAALSPYVPYDPSAELDRMERKIQKKEAHVAALTETTSNSWEMQFRMLEDPAIEGDLQALKSGTLFLSGRQASPPPIAALGGEEFDELIEQELRALKSGIDDPGSA